MFKISEASEEDIPAIIEIAEKTWWPTYSPILSTEQIQFMLSAIFNPEALKKEIANGYQTFLLLSDERGPQAFASFGKRLETPAVHKLHKLYVLPDNQKKGYGQALIREVKHRLLAKDVHTLDLNVNRFNSALHFYEKTGFKRIREEDVPIGPYWMNDFVMRLEF
ncbi:MAG TPA: GNAT family N-acetyltransferase [Chryseosolibacter sp.]|jgi:Sortase and related acyltransferases